MSMVEVFVPIHLYVSGFSFKEIALFLIVKGITCIVYTFVGMKVISWFGFSRSYAFSFIPVCAYFILIASIESHNISLYVLPLLGQFAVFYWLWHHVSLAKYTEEGSRNSQVVMLQTLGSISKIIGPLVGGVILTYLGMNYLTAFVLLILAVSVFFMAGVNNHKEAFFFMPALHAFLQMPKKQMAVFMARGINNKFHGVIWPMLAFTLYFNNYILLGLSVTLIALSGIFVGHFASSAFDKNERLGLRIGGAGLSVIWLIRILAVGPLGVFITNAFTGVLEKLTATSFNALSYGYAQKHTSIVYYTVVREVGIHISALIVALLLFFVADWLQLLPLAAISSLVYFLF